MLVFRRSMSLSAAAADERCRSAATKSTAKAIRVQGVTMAQSKLVLVTGATGKQGGAVVEALLTRGHQVRALTRNAASPAANRLREQGVEIAVGDFTDPDALVRATRGA